MIKQRLIAIATILLLNLSQVEAQSFSPYSYSIGTPTLTDYYIDPLNGSDANNGLSASTPWRTVQHAWNQIPESALLPHGYRFNLMNGDYGNDELPNYWELREGTESKPIILRAAAGQDNVRFVRDINMANVSYFYLINVNITPSGGGDAFHCERCDHILIRGSTLNGTSTTGGAHETVKFNQSQYVYLENNNISNADDNNIDFVGVQYGHIIGNKIHDALDWCVYVKGGSAYIRVESNQIYNCGTGGFTAGQGTGFQFMTSPWIHYEAYDIKFINNLIHNTEGAAFGTNGGYNILLAHNTAYRVGSRSHLVEVVFGERTCDGNSDGDADSTCAEYNAAGGWGADRVSTTPEPIGSKNVFVLNNIIYNPSGFVAPQHFAIYGPRIPAADRNLTSPQIVDANLVIKGNYIWNGPGTAAVGVEDSGQGCQSGNPTCTLSQIAGENTINFTEPELQDPENRDFRPALVGNVFSKNPALLEAFPGGDRISTPIAPEGVLLNSFARDYSGLETIYVHEVGAFNLATSENSPPAIDESDTPGDPSDESPPTLQNFKVSATVRSKKVLVNISVKVLSPELAIDSVRASIVQRSKLLKTFKLRKVGSKYQVKGTVKGKRGTRYTINLMAANAGGTSSLTRTTKAK